MAKPVKIYTTTYCPFCQRAKNLLQQEGISFDEVDITSDPKTREKLQKETGWMTVPLIFIKDEFIGGSDDLAKLAASGELKKMAA